MGAESGSGRAGESGARDARYTEGAAYGEGRLRGAGIMIVVA